ncbi:response regulator [Lysobacter sp. M15]|uniref:response regulator n=1 Tax=Lysobacter sp. M15 TaxID=2916837 RepID=UPI001F5848C2|nr:response regulator [Lysobacter sp. M15]
MTALSDAIDRTALGWVKPELDALLAQARREVEAFADSPRDAAAMATCVQLLQQVRGSLQMLDLQAGILLTDEMHQLAQALQQGGVADAEAANAALMRALVQLPDYLERLQGGHRDVPVVLLPLLDELRAARGAAGFDEAQLVAMAGPEPATEFELAHARAALGGRNRALMGTVSAAVKEDLMQVKDALDLHLRGSQRSVDTLKPHAEALGRIAGTLAMIGLDGASARIGAQRDALAAIADGQRPASADALLEIAGTLLQVDASLDEQVERMGSHNDGAGNEALASETRRVTAVLLQEAANNIARVRESTLTAMLDGWHPAELAEVPRLLHEVGGALRMLDQAHPADLATGIQGYVQSELLGRETSPDANTLERVADAVSSLEMYLEGLEDGGRREDLLDITRASLATLGYWPLPKSAAEATFGERPEVEVAQVATAQTVAAQDQPADTAAAPASEAAAVVEEVVAAVTPASAAASGFEQTGDEIDDEIREVFLEEFEEEIGNLGQLLPAWRSEPDNTELLRPIRRVFHTLKGSGRLVGAKLLGEFSWKIENMLNRVLDGSRPASPAVIALVEQAHASLPQLHAALRGAGAVSADLDGLQQVADRVASGEEVRFATAAAATPAPAAEPEPTPEPELEPEQPQGFRATVDPVLLEILEAEVTGHLQTIEHWLSKSAPRPDETLLRALHTSNGAFAMTEVPAITDTLGQAEAYVKRLLLSDRPALPEGVAALGEVAATVRETLVALRSADPRVSGTPELAARLTALRDALPDPTAFDTRALDALGAQDLAMPDLVEPFEPGPLDALLQGHAGLASDHAEAERLASERAEAELRATQAAEAALLEAERIAFEQAEAKRQAAEQAEAARLEAERLEAERLEAERLEAERLEAERLEAERLEAERLEAERLEAERLEAERLEAERVEAERLEAERLEAERLEAARLEAERLAAERAEMERLEAERLAAARNEAERAEAERLTAERIEAERVEAERLEAERAEAARLGAERLEAERLEAERVEAERLEAERLEAERVEAERIEAERLEAERLEAERLEAERLEAERVEAERLEAERVEAERLEAERVEAERLEAERLEAERIAAEQAEARRIEAERIAAEQAEARRIAAEQAEAERQARREQAEAARVAELLASAAASASAEDPDEALDLTDLDPELVDLFVEEARDLLDHSDGLLAKLRDAPEGRDTVIGLQRDLHTIKGGARMAGVMAVGELGHAMESLLELVAEQKLELGRGDIPLLERGFDRLHGMVTRVGARRAIGMPEGLIAEFAARVRGETVGADAGADKPKFELKPLSAPIGTGMDLEDEEVGVRAPQEQVRIRADLLDRLVNYAGEVAIYRARLEQQLGAFRAAMFEMEQTNARLRDQLRRLDAETEAQIIARFQREQDVADPTFDPLELDRFSTLQQLSRGLAESAADMASLQGTLDDLTRQYETLLLQQSRVSSDLQEGLMRTRMVPFDALVPRLRRVLRQAATDTGKAVQLRLDNAQGELDRNVLERMTAPLEHMLRNAVAHGLESPAARKQAKKDEEGTVRIAVRREGSEVVLEVGDDGAGLDRTAIRRRAEERGLVRADAVLADSDLDMLIMEPGFSTAGEVSRLAGRGVGMDVVASEVRQLGGTLDIHSKAGEGTTFTLRLPQTLAVTQAVFVRIGETSFAVPIASVRGVGRISREDLAKPDASYRYGGEDYALHDLGTLLGQAPARAEGQVQMPLLLIRSGDLRAAVSIDHVIGNREIVVKPVGPQVASIPGIFGATIMGDGRVVVILDVAPLVRRSAALPREAEPASQPELRRVPLVMVVDDSITMRKVTGRVLERHNYEVMTAKDGIDALERMDERVPDLMLLDIEMPRMDGYELATQMRSDPRLRGVPIIMITSRTGEKHRQRALEIGVQRYLGKPYQEPELMRNVFELLGTGPEYSHEQ